MPDSSASPESKSLSFVLIGVFISLWLCGVLSFQTLNFYTNYPNERRWLKAFVGILVAADGIHTLMGVAIIWNILTKYSMRASDDIPPGLAQAFLIYPVLVGLISGSVQIFFAWRIKVLSRSLLLFAFIVVLAIPQFAGGIAYTVLTLPVKRFSELSGFVGVIVGWVGSSVVCDLTITSALTIILRRHRANRDLGEAVHLIQRVKIVSIHNGLVTIIWSLALLIALAVAKQGGYYMFFYPLGKVYLITMLSSLNSRPVVRPELDPRISSALQRSSTPQIPSLSLRLSREFTCDVEKLGRPISQVSSHSRTASRGIEYLPVTQEEDEDVPFDHNAYGRPSIECTEVQPLVEDLSPRKSLTFSPPRSPPRGTITISNRPRGPRLPTVPCSVACRSVSA